MSNILFRPAEASDSRAIVQLASESFAEERRALLVYSCFGAEAFVRGHITINPAVAERRYSVAQQAAGDVVAVVDLLRLPDAIHLAYIAVAPFARGMRLASRLLLHALKRWHAPAHDFQLDVFADNRVAVRWYDRLGVEAISESTWCRASQLPEVKASVPSGYVLGLPAADVVHEQFGFSDFIVQTSRARYTVGRIGNDWFRMTDSAALDDPELCTCLRSLDTQRGLLILASSEATLVERGFVPVAATQRRGASLEALISRLEHLS